MMDDMDNLAPASPGDPRPGDIVPSQRTPPFRITKVEKHPLFTLTTGVGVEPKPGRPKNTAAKRRENARWLEFYNQCRAQRMSKTAAIKKAAETFNVKRETARSRYRRLLSPPSSGQ